MFDPSSSGDDASSSDFLAVSSLCKILSLTLTKKDWHDTQNDFTTKILLTLKGRVRLMTPLQILIAVKVGVS